MESEGRLPPSVDWTREAKFWFSREPYTGRNRITLLQLAITLAVGGMAIVNLIVWAYHGGNWVNAASCGTLAAVMFYPAVRHRIERGRWPD
ncbi:hypothetical protein MKK84_05375 [Methylobacterium sp. E-065]|uniref:hypothetical protein n=1 Tax=Methylobacterium sp. E-065 TaxID=2836583 RepID=UPI001FBA89A6|nr:hypothetical protein [Methylobacterium sp. E-065]MCJ2016863.1 hypothetical protein [Methylobacterium sp. E-065]